MGSRKKIIQIPRVSVKPKLRSVATILLCYITKKILVFPSISAVLKQYEIKSVACRNESTNFYIRQFYNKAKFALLSASVWGWKPSEHREQAWKETCSTNMNHLQCCVAWNQVCFQGNARERQTLLLRILSGTNRLREQLSQEGRLKLKNSLS